MRAQPVTPISDSPAPARAAAQSAQAQLMQWLLSKACPLWSTRGVDPVHGGFQEVLGDDSSEEAPRRARVQPRQVCAFAGASELGWQGNAAQLATHGLDYFLSRYRRPDGLFRTLIAPDGAVLDDRALLYDQAFALLALAQSQSVLGAHPELTREALLLRSLLYEHLKRPGPGFESGLPLGQPLLSNPHMHLLEASLAWSSISNDPAWQTLADEIVSLALSRFIDPVSGAVREYFDATWSPMGTVAGRIIEPGHQFEWAWLLLRWDAQDARARAAALRLIELGERHGVHQGVAVNALLDDYSIHEGAARLWPQTERLKAGSLAARLTGEACYWAIAAAAGQSLLRYLDTAVAGLWYDRLTPSGEFVIEPSPASSFYHIVAAIAELNAALGVSPAQRARAVQETPCA